MDMAIGEWQVCFDKTDAPRALLCLHWNNAYITLYMVRIFGFGVTLWKGK